jgi:hypothetical protein
MSFGSLWLIFQKHVVVQILKILTDENNFLSSEVQVQFGPFPESFFFLISNLRQEKLRELQKNINFQFCFVLFLFIGQRPRCKKSDILKYFNYNCDA